MFITCIDDSEDDCVDKNGDILITCIRNIGVSGIGGWIQCLKHKKNENEMIKYATRLFNTEFGPNIKIIDQSKQMLITRMLSVITINPLGFRRLRSYMIADQLKANTESTELMISGYLRGSPLNIYSIIHITGVGNFNIKSIKKEHDPMPVNVLLIYIFRIRIQI